MKIILKVFSLDEVDSTPLRNLVKIGGRKNSEFAQFRTAFDEGQILRMFCHENKIWCYTFLG